MADMTEAQRRRIDKVMLESLSTSFKMFGQGHQFMCSFNAMDVSEMLARVAKIVAPGPRRLSTDRGERDDG